MEKNIYNSSLMLDVEQAVELREAFRCGGWTNEEIKKACNGNHLTRFRQVVLGDAVIRMPNDLIVFHVFVDRNRTPQKAIKKMHWTKRLGDDKAFVSMPRGKSNKTNIFFFEIDFSMSHADLENQYKLRNLEPADPYLLAVANEKNPIFTDYHINSTIWKDADNNWCHATFVRWPNEYVVCIGHNNGDQPWIAGGHWFAGVHI